jgi:hypothetical protein
MRRPLFERIVERLRTWDRYFDLNYDAVGRAGLSGLQKCVAAIRVLAYGLPHDIVDEYVRIGESTTCEAVKKFCEGIIACYKDQYLRLTNPDDVRRILDRNKERGFPGMLGSIDCMH